jgi:PKD repeat protein
MGILLSINPLLPDINGISVNGNDIQNCNRGLAIRGTKGLAVTNNVISDSSGSGILLMSARDGMISQNQFRNNPVGIEIMYPSYITYMAGNNTIVDNYFNNVNQVKIDREVDAAKGDLFMDKIKGSPNYEEIKDTVSAIEDDSTSDANYWNITKIAGTNIVGGPYLGGNYWASPDGTGFSETHADRGDGFCNESYVFDEWNIDYLPLHTYTPKPTFYADFTVSPVNGTVPLTVKCTDKSVGKPTMYVYNFGDGVNVTGPNPIHTYRFPGVYTVTLTVTKRNTTTNSVMSNVATKTNAINVTSVPVVPLVAKFAASPVSGYAPMTVSFIDQSVGNPTFYNYNFGDGMNASGRDPVHTYQFPGIYNVTLTIIRADPTTGLILSNSSIQKDLITISG